MNDRLRLINEGEIEMLFVDSSDLSPEEILSLLSKMRKLSLQKKIRYNILDLSNTRTSNDIKQQSQRNIQEIEAQIGKIYMALIGLKGLQKTIANAISSRNYFAVDYSDAVRWLQERAKEHP